MEQGFIGILQAAQEHVLLQIVAERAEGVEPPLDLQIERRHVRRQQAVQVEGVALGVGERRALVQQRIVEQLVAAERGLDDACTAFVHHRGPKRETIVANGSTVTGAVTVR